MGSANADRTPTHSLGPAALTQRRRVAKHLPVLQENRLQAPGVSVIVLHRVDAAYPHGGHWAWAWAWAQAQARAQAQAQAQA